MSWSWPQEPDGPPPEPVHLVAPLPPVEQAEWQGAYTPYAVGDPGRAAGRVRPGYDSAFPGRPDTILDGIVVNGPEDRPSVTVRAASVRGLSHRHYARVRQDDYALRRTPDGRYLVACVADGVSSGPRSHFAAWWAAHDGTDELVRLLSRTGPDDLPWPGFLQWTANRIVALAGDHIEGIGTDPAKVAAELATALTYTVIELTAGPDGQAAHLISVGDTSGWILTADGRWCPQQPVKNAGADIYSSGVSALPLLPQVPPTPTHTMIGPDEVLVLMTDGVGDPLGDGSGAVGRFLAHAWHEPPADIEFAAQIGFARRSFDDDRTVIAVWPARR
jgi:hypothetical protein